MIKPKESIRLQGSILNIVEGRESTFCIDNTFRLTEIDNSLKIKGNMQVTKHAKPPHRYSHAFGISRFAYCCVPIMGEHKVFILEFRDGKVQHISTLEDHDGDIEACGFSKNGEIFATGGQDGRVFFYDAKSFLPLGSLMARSDYISVITFSQNSEFLAISGFDKFTMVFDILRHKIIFNFVTNDVVESSAFFDNDEKLMLVCRNNSSIIFSLKDGKIISQEYPFAFWPTSIAIQKDSNFALVGTRSNVIYIISTKDNSKIMEIEDTYSGISNISFAHGLLYIGYIDGTLLVVNHKESEEKLKTSLESKNYKEAREAVDENVFLSIHPLMKEFDEAWAGVLQEAIDMLNKDQIDEAVSHVAPFIVDESKKNEFDFYLSQKEGVQEFISFIEKKDYTKAYEMVRTTKFLAKTQSYERLENIWNKAFSNAKKLLVENAQANYKIAEQHLAPFENTPKKELIVQLLRNCDVFSKAESIIKQQNFKEYFALTMQFSFLRETDLYKKVLIFGEKMLTNVIELEKDLKYDEAKKIADTLLCFPNLKRSAQERLVSMQQKENFFEAINNKDIKKVYNMVDEIESLRSLQEFKIFTQDFLNKFEEAKTYSYAGNAQHIIVIFGEYMEIPYWIDKIASLMKVAYLKQISNALDEIDVNWNMTLRRYVDRFGCGLELVKLLQNHSSNSILDNFERDCECDGYRHLGFVPNIVIYKTQNAQ